MGGMALNLYAPPNVLPLAWQFRERLTGEVREEPYRQDSPTGPAATPTVIDAALSRMRGLVNVVVELLHKISPSAPVNVPLVPTTIEYSLFAPSPPFALDAGTLGTAFYRELKPYVEAYRNAEGGTPGEVYAMEAHVTERRAIEAAEARPEPPPVEARPRPRRVRPPAPAGYVYTVRYRDRETGAYASADTWRRSRAAKRGAAKRAGRRAGAGRYVRVVERRPVR